MIPTIFFGTHQFAATVLETIIASGLFDIKLVITMPDRPAGRHQEIQKSAVKSVAEKHELKILQPDLLKNIRYPIFDIHLNIVVDYGAIIPQEIIDTPKFGSINIHPSLLPKYRGASPIQSALMAGEKETGITIMQMDKEMDHGPIIKQEKIKIEQNEIFPELYVRLAERAGELLVKIIPKYIAGEIKPIPQEHNYATFTKMLTREDGKIDFKMKTATEVYNLFRGLTPWPGIFTVWNNKRLKLLEFTLSDKIIIPGKVLVENKRLFVGTQEGSVEVIKMQLEGKMPMYSEDFLIGYGKIDGAEF